MSATGPERLAGIPSGLWSRVSASGRIAARLSASGARRVFGSSEEADRKLGEALLSELDQLKGMAMKIGQILSYMDVGLPDEVTTRLAQLQAGVRPLSGATIRAVIERDLGQPVDTVFAALDDEAFAAASIGQVHRGRTHSDERVVVKVRYPGIEKTIDGDFAVLAPLARVAGSMTAVDGPALVQELRTRIVQECDYAREARWQARFGVLFGDDPEIAVPAVFPALCGPSVLTTAEHSGQTFTDFCGEADAAPRLRAGQALMRLLLSPLLRRGFVHADPHPGNQLYRGDGSLVALDYGCVKTFDAAWLQPYRQLCRAVIDGDRKPFADLVHAIGLTPRPKRVDHDAMWALFTWLYAPLSTPRFAFTRTWWEAGRRFTSPRMTNSRHWGMPPQWLWIQRVQWGLWALMTKLRAEGEFAAPYRSWLQDGIAGA